MKIRILSWKHKRFNRQKMPFVIKFLLLIAVLDSFAIPVHYSRAFDEALFGITPEIKELVDTVVEASAIADIASFGNTQTTQEVAYVSPIPEKHVVKKGEGVWKITNRYGWFLDWQLRDANGLRKNEYLQPGQVLELPDPNWQPYEGNASWYGPGFHGRLMANGQIYDQNQILVAHRTYPLGMKVRITNLETGESLIAPVLDRGPYSQDENGEYLREIDLSRAAAEKLGAIDPGVISVRIEPLRPDIVEAEKKKQSA